jgi:riboflavin synthase
MFSGIVEAVGRIVRVQDRERVREFWIQAPAIVPELTPGQSVAVDGACLTTVRTEGDAFLVEAIATTLSRTVAARYAEGMPVNLERAMRMGDRLDGHLVQGHVDGLGELVSARLDGEFHLLDVRIPERIAQGTLLHGSICLNGVSLTVNALEGEICQVGIIPFTWEHTNLRSLAPGDPLNVEGDMIGKYVARWLSVERGPTRERIRNGQDHAL